MKHAGENFPFAGEAIKKATVRRTDPPSELKLRMRASSREDADWRDGLHGLLVWALASLLTAVIGLATAQSKLSRCAPPKFAKLDRKCN
jgi:hypothetical protein